MDDLIEGVKTLVCAFCGFLFTFIWASIGIISLFALLQFVTLCYRQLHFSVL